MEFSEFLSTGLTTEGYGNIIFKPSSPPNQFPKKTAPFLHHFLHLGITRIWVHRLTSGGAGHILDGD